MATFRSRQVCRVPQAHEGGARGGQEGQRRPAQGGAERAGRGASILDAKEAQAGYFLRDTQVAALKQPFRKPGKSA